jgi:K+-transporting ATPase KdpF subunit
MISTPNIIGLVCGVAVVIYLFAALIRPDKFLAAQGMSPRAFAAAYPGSND